MSERPAISPEIQAKVDALVGVIDGHFEEKARAAGKEFSTVVEQNARANAMDGMLKGVTLKGMGGVTVASETASNSVPNAVPQEPGRTV